MSDPLPPWFEWVDGMRYRYHDLDLWDRVEVLPDGRVRQPIDAAPDWTDAATIGALTGLVRRMTGDPRLYVRPNADGVGWMIVSLDLGWAFVRPTEHAALLAAGDAAHRGGGA